MGPTVTSSDEVANAGNPVDAALNPVTNGIGNGTGLLRNAIAQIPLVSDIAEASVSEAAGETVEDVGVTAGAARSCLTAVVAQSTPTRPQSHSDQASCS